MLLYNLQYLVSGILSLLVSFYILFKHPKTLALKSLLLFGLVTSLWEVSNFISRTASDMITAANFFAIMLISSHVCYPLYLLTVLNIREKRSGKVNILVILPAMMQLAIMIQHEYFINYRFFLTEFGWSYKVVSYNPLLIAVSLIFIGYLVGVIVILFNLVRKTRFPLWKKKYMILFFSFMFFQAIGTTLLNAGIALNFLNPSFRIGGILQFLTFLSIWYVLFLKEKEYPLSFIESKDFSRIYSSFLTIYYNSTTGSSLGEEVFQFIRFVRNSGIENNVLLDKGGIVFREVEDLDLVELIKKNLEFFDKNSVDARVIDCYLRVLNAADKKLGWKFESIVKEYEDFLKKTDLIYGISGGRFLEKITVDKSLRDLDDIEACLKIYRRILYPISSEILRIKYEFQKKLSEHYITEEMKITDFGEILLDDVKERLMRLPEDKRLSHAIDVFNSILSWIYERLLREDIIGVEDLLSKLRLVLRLNKDSADKLGIYPSLLGKLATKIPKKEIHQVYSDYLEELVEEKTRELKKAHEELLKSQRLAVIGEAAAMIGHDLRNPLQAIVYSLFLAKKELELSPNPNLIEIIRIIEKQVEYMNKIVSDLQDYARPIKPNIVETNFEKIVREVLSTVEIPSNIKVNIDFDKASKSFPTDPLLMKRVLANLITNAIQAMENGGLLNISAYKKDSNVFISIQDTGVGIPEENLSKIFQPFFTTKAKGQGLGLAVCKRIIESLQGSITLDSKVGKGTTVTIKLPIKRSSTQKLQLSL